MRHLTIICCLFLFTLVCVQPRRILLGTVPILSGDSYNYQSKDWASVISSCRALGNFEKRIMNFYVRSSFHDSLTVIPNSCSSGACPGLDASVYLTSEDLRPEDSFKNFTYISGQTAIQIANLYNVSVADTLAVCAATAVQFLGGPNIVQTGQLRVGRLDSETSAPFNLLPASTINATEFMSFFGNLGFTSDDMAALIGAHSLIAEQGCFQGPAPNDFCDPNAGSCNNVKMFRWDVHYYQDICTPAIQINPIPAGQTSVSVPVTAQNVANVSSSNKCQWTSSLFQNQVQANINQELASGGSRPASDVVFVDWPSNCNTGRKLQESTTTSNQNYRKLLQGKPGGGGGNPGGQGGPGGQGNGGGQGGPGGQSPQPAAANHPPQPAAGSHPPQPATGANAPPLPTATPSPTPNPNGGGGGGGNGQITGCPHIPTWFYTRNDAYLGEVCQGIFPTTPAPSNLLALQGSLRKYLNEGAWNGDFATAYLKMVNVYANFAPGTPYSITGQECFSGYVPASGSTCTQAQCSAACPGNNCPSCCTCSSAVQNVAPLLSTINMAALNI